MALRLAGQEIAVQEKSEHISYTPGLQDSGDLELGTKTVTATSKQATEDYTTSLTIAAPGDSRIAVVGFALKLSITIDSFNGGAATLYCSVEVNGTERVTGNFTTAGNKYAGTNLTVPAQANLGTANTIKVYFWVDTGNVVLSLVQLKMAIGSYGENRQNAFSLTHRGLCFFTDFTGKYDGGSSSRFLFMYVPDTPVTGSYTGISEQDPKHKPILLAGKHYAGSDPLTTTTLDYLASLKLILRSLE